MCCNIYNWWQRQAHMHILDTPWVGVSPPSSKNALATIENHVVLLYVPRYKYTRICTVISTIGFNSTDRIFWFYWHILWSSMWCKDTKKYWFNGCLISLACRGLKTHRVKSSIFVGHRVCHYLFTKGNWKYVLTVAKAFIAIQCNEAFVRYLECPAFLESVKWVGSYFIQKPFP